MDSNIAIFTIVTGAVRIDINGTSTSYDSWDSAITALQTASQEGKLKDADVRIYLRKEG